MAAPMEFNWSFLMVTSSQHMDAVNFFIAGKLNLLEVLLTRQSSLPVLGHGSALAEVDHLKWTSKIFIGTYKEQNLNLDNDCLRTFSVPRHSATSTVDNIEDPARERQPLRTHNGRYCRDSSFQRELYLCFMLIFWCK